MSNARKRRSGRTGGRARGSVRVRAFARCGSPGGCSRPVAHELVDPVYGGVWAACEDHWPDLVAMLWAEGAWVSGCPCSECVTAAPNPTHFP